MKPLILKIKQDFMKDSIPFIRRVSPVQFVVASYFILILIGAVLLAQPFASALHKRTPFVDSLFTSTSAVAVTGLVVKDTATHWSWIGQLIIILLVQIGGLGYITIFTFFIILIGRRLSLRQGALLQETLNSVSLKDIGKLAHRIFYFVVFLEGIGASILFLRFFNFRDLLHFNIRPIFNVAWKGIFHSIAAFNNAGFDLNGNFKSFTDYVSDPIANLTLTGLIIIGGIGFCVLSDLYQKLKFRKNHSISFHSKIAIFTTIFLIITGTVLIFLIEHDNPKTLGQLDLSGKLWASYFQSVTARTAGFNTIPIGALTNASLLLIIVLMFIGASPGGTGGGIKTTTAASLFYYVKATIKRKEMVDIGNRRVPYETINKAVTIFVLSSIFIFFVTWAILLVEPFSAVNVAFEVVSAYGTVGLSTGITPLFSPISKYLLSLTMFAGRVGLLSLLLTFSMRIQRGKVLLPEGELAVG